MIDLARKYNGSDELYGGKRCASRAYSTAETTLTSSAPAAIWRLSAVGTPSTRVASSGTMPRSIAPYTG